MHNRKNGKAFFLILTSLIVAGLFVNENAMAQSALATLEGKVTDDTGAPLPGASISLKNTASGYVLGSVARPDGSYIISGIQAGTYDITVSLSNFATQIRKGVTIAVGATLSLGFILTPATISQEVTVVGEAPMIEVTKSEISTVVDREMIETLPLLNRDFSGLSVVKAGVIEGVANGQPFGSGEMIVDGSSGESVMQNGVLTMIPADAIQEFRVITNQAMPEFGNMSGLVTTAITRSGTNQIKGRLSLFYRNENLASPNYFVNHAEYDGPELPKDQWQESPYSRWNFSGFIGGPIKKDKAHFFITFEGIDTKPYVMITSPLVARESVEQKTWNYHILAKFNYQLNKSNQFSLRFDVAPLHGDNQGIGGLYTKERAYTYRERNFSAHGEWTWFPSSNTMNELRAQFNYMRSYSDPLDNSLYTIERPSGYLGKDQVLLQYNNEDKYELADNFSLFLGDHSLKAGIDYIYSPSGTSRMDLYQPGMIVFTTDEPFDAGNPDTYPYLFQYNSSTTPVSLNMPYSLLGIFVQDSWKVHPRFTLNYGLRWNYYDLTGLKFKPGDIHNFNPRIGFSWDPTGEGKSSIRGGIGTYSANLNSQCAVPVMFWKQFKLRIRVFPGYPDPHTLNPFIPVKIDFPADTGDYVSSTLIPPWSLQASLGYQRELAKDISASVDVIYSKGYNLLRAENLNPVIPGTIYDHVDPTRTNVMAVSDKGKSEYKGLYLTFSKRYTNGWSLDVAYTLSKSMADTDSQGGDLRVDQGGITQPWSYDANAWWRAYGRTFYDARHKLTITGIVDLPLGIQLTGLFYYRSAFPWNAIYAEDVNLDSLTGDYVDFHRNSRTGFDAMWLNLRLSKFINLSSSFRAQLFAEAYNITNRANFTTVDNIYGTALFGTPIEANDPRVIQLGVRLDW